MRIFGCCLALLAGALIGFGAPAQEPAKDPQATNQTNQDSLPAWAPGPLATQKRQATPGRVASRAVGIAFTLPESWRADDVSWRELASEEAKTINPMAEAALVVELAGSERLLTVFRVSLKAWREADRDGKAGPGRVAMVDGDTGFVVQRPAEPSGRGRYATLHDSLEDAIGTLVQFDAHHEESRLVGEAGASFAGVSADGTARVLKLESDGALKLSYGDPVREVAGSWLQRDSQIIGKLKDPGAGVSPALLFHFDGKALVVVRWDEKAFGNLGVRLEPAE